MHLKSVHLLTAKALNFYKTKKYLPQSIPTGIPPWPFRPICRQQDQIQWVVVHMYEYQEDTTNQEH